MASARSNKTDQKQSVKLIFFIMFPICSNVKVGSMEILNPPAPYDARLKKIKSQGGQGCLGK